MLYKDHVPNLPKMSFRSKKHWFSPNFIKKVKEKKGLPGSSVVLSGPTCVGKYLLDSRIY
jgi:hypothetical protein